MRQALAEPMILHARAGSNRENEPYHDECQNECERAPFRPMHASPKKKYPNKVPPIIDVMDRFLSVCGPRTLVGGRGLGDIPKRPSLSFSLPSNEMRRLVTFTFAMLFPVLAHATQVTPTGVEYTNDTIEQGGKLAACIVTTAIISPPAPEIVNFQVLVVGGTHAFKITAGDVDWTKGAGVAKRISAADFSTAQFNHPSAFKKSITSEGQLVGYLREPKLNGEFLKAFFGGRYTIRFMRADQKDERTYYIEQAPGSDVTNAFRLCLGSMRETR
jgi:hypothetical protein